MEFVSARLDEQPVGAGGDVILVDSIAAAVVAPWSCGTTRRTGIDLSGGLHWPPFCTSLPAASTTASYTVPCRRA